MNQQKQNILIVETKDTAKYQGIFVSKDIQKQIITLSNVKKTFQGKEEQLPSIEITKENIKSINIIDVRPPKEDIHNINEIPENKKSVIDENKLANVEKAYDKSKDDFFDQLKPLTNPEVKKESKYYNKKNKDTFSLPEDTNDNKREWRGRGKRGYGRGRGRGRGGYRGGYNNYYENQNNYGGYDNKNGGNSNYQGQNYYNNRGRGRGRGRGRSNRGGYKNNYNHSGESNSNNNLANQNNENNVINNQD